MKKVKFQGKLSLNKETVTKLTNNQMKSVNGGLKPTLISCAACYESVWAPTTVVGCYAC